jgi:hypothetical protein
MYRGFGFISWNRDVTLPLLDAARAKMMKLEEVIGEQLELDGCALEETVVEHMLTSFQSRDPQVSLEPMVEGPIAKIEEATWTSISNTVKLVAAWFHRQAEDA